MKIFQKAVIGGIKAVVRADGTVEIAPHEEQGAPWFKAPPGCEVVKNDWRELADPEQLRKAARSSRMKNAKNDYE